MLQLPRQTLEFLDCRQSPEAKRWRDDRELRHGRRELQRGHPACQRSGEEFVRRQRQADALGQPRRVHYIDAAWCQWRRARRVLFEHAVVDALRLDVGPLFREHRRLGPLVVPAPWTEWAPAEPSRALVGLPPGPKSRPHAHTTSPRRARGARVERGLGGPYFKRPPGAPKWGRSTRGSACATAPADPGPPRPPIDPATVSPPGEPRLAPVSTEW